MSYGAALITPLTPGGYFAARRAARQLSAVELAERIDCLPHIGVHDRAAWLRLIEADVMPASWSTIAALSEHLALDLDLLAALDAARLGSDAAAPAHCHTCGITPRQLQEAPAWPSEILCPGCKA
ncbi:hypothetical protein [Sphingomonas sp. BK580]|uniref:hypothetical protein n=1 Tax=Sphingomonas sp. BK580 TaxID=2586972 RepID=UPI001615727F|nr:hypothetical protein [Sphingomonas sp. BK580]MBB3691479.1 transcriptional regulator with XRE-family HTH domain [Sphingomonas sp. BK580]